MMESIKIIDSILSVSHLQLRSRECGHDVKHNLLDIGVQVLHNNKNAVEHRVDIVL